MLRQSYDAIKKEVDPWIGKEIDVPVPKDPAGGYTHERHKAQLYADVQQRPVVQRDR